MKSYNISRYEQTGEQLFICLTSTTTSVYHEHFFTEEEKLDIEGTIERLVAELEIKEEEYVPPPIVVNKIKELDNITLKEKKIQEHKIKLINNKVKQDERDNINLNGTGD